MDIIVEKYTFYNDGVFYDNVQKTTGKRQYEDVPELSGLSIVIVGTEKQNDVLFKKYVKKHNLALDECFDITDDIKPIFLDTLTKRYINNNKNAYII